MSLSSNLRFIGAQKTVTTAGTRERLATGRPEDMNVTLLIIKALTTNTGKVYVGDITVDATHCLDLDPGDVLIYEVEMGDYRIINMAEIYLDVAVDGEGVNYQYVRE